MVIIMVNGSLSSSGFQTIPTIMEIQVLNVEVRVSCNNTGFISFFVIGGKSVDDATPYEASINGGTSQFSSSQFEFSDLPLGEIYNITVGTHCGSINLGPFEFTEYGEPVVNKKDVSCNGGSDGMVEISMSGNDGPYSFFVTAPSFSQTGTNTFLNDNLSANTYLVTMFDRHGCPSSFEFTIGEPVTALTASGAVTEHETCSGANDGIITITPDGGTGPYEFNRGVGWQNSGVFDELTQGNYTINVRDANGCETSTFVIVGLKSLASLSASVSGDACYDEDGHTFKATVSGDATYTYNYSYVITPGEMVGSGSISAKSTEEVDIYIANPGTYTVNFNLWYHAGCTPVTNSGTVTMYDEFVFTSLVATQHVTCTGVSDGIITANVTGGLPPYTYTLLGYTPSGNTFTVPAGDYTVSVSDDKGCDVSPIDRTIKIEEPTLTIDDVNVLDPDCYGDEGTVTLTVSWNVPPDQTSRFPLTLAYTTTPNAASPAFPGSSSNRSGSYNPTFSLGFGTHNISVSAPYGACPTIGDSEIGITVEQPDAIEITSIAPQPQVPPLVTLNSENNWTANCPQESVIFDVTITGDSDSERVLEYRINNTGAWQPLIRPASIK